MKRIFIVLFSLSLLLTPIKVANADIDLLSLDSETLHEYLLDGYVAKVWWDLANTERREVADRIIAEWGQPFGMIQKVAILEGRKGIIIGGRIIDDRIKEFPCVYNAIIRYSILNHPITEQEQFYWHEKKWHSVTGEGFGLPVYFIRVSADWDKEQGEYSFDHAVAGLQIKKPLSNFNSWLFFQYTNGDIQPPNSQMPKDSRIEVYELLSTDFYGDFNYDVADLLQEWDFSVTEPLTYADWLYDNFIALR